MKKCGCIFLSDCDPFICPYDRKGECKMLLYDPPSGWMYGFPKPYKPREGESLRETLLRDGYPMAEIAAGGAAHVRFLGSKEENSLGNIPKPEV